MSDKIKPQHLTRKAILYVRQSTAYQVSNNLESQRLQYAMETRLRALGWSQVEIIDEDLGRSAAGTATRTGFERMVAQVCLGEVGAVCAREVSRFARNSREWQQLVEVCRIVDTLLIDQETVYSPRQTNDRLLLGLKGTLNEYELDLLRQRAQEARIQKARRGEFVSNIPVGFVKGEERVLEKDPDERIQRSNSCSRSSSNSVARDKYSSGSSSTSCRSPLGRSMAMFIGAVLATATYIAFFATRVMPVPTPTVRLRAIPSTTTRSPEYARGVAAATDG